MDIKDYQMDFHHPVKNFKNADFWGKNSEHEFGSNFIKLFKPLSDKKVIAIRELPVPGSGIPDLVLIKKSDHKKHDQSKTTVQSFEFKIKNWRKGLMQAHRYKYFSNSSILVVPSNSFKSIQKSIDLFRQLGVGLWAFNASSGSIAKKFTPRPKKIANAKSAAYILDKALEYHIHS